MFIDVSSVELVEGQEYVLFSFAGLQGEFERLELIGSSCQDYTAEPVYEATEIRVRILTVTTYCAASAVQTRRPAIL